MEAPKPITQRPIWTMTADDLQNLEMTLTLEEWHRQRDADERWTVVAHESELVA